MQLTMLILLQLHPITQAAILIVLGYLISLLIKHTVSILKHAAHQVEVIIDSINVYISRGYLTENQLTKLIYASITVIIVCISIYKIRYA
jgi:hypothetical protein